VTIRAAIYARRSKEEHQAASLDVQESEGRRWCASRGWEVVRVFVDDSVSRAEFVKRPGLIATLRAAEDKAFDVLVIRDESRLGGDMVRTGLVQQELADAGVKLFHYITGEEARFDDPTSRFLAAAKNFSSELERVKIASRTREHLEVKARRGFVAGGSVYGYRNVEVIEGDRRVRVEYAIDDAQAAVILDIFARYIAGDGLRTIAKALNARGVPAARAGKRGTGSWAPSSVREILHRERYRGVLIWGQRAKGYRGGTRVRDAAPPEQHVRVEAPHLRIVPDELWLAVATRSQRLAKVTGTTARGPAPKYLLTGFGRCADCGGPIHVHRVKVSAVTQPAYMCAYHRDRGNTVCGNSLRRPVAGVDAKVVAHLRTVVLTPAFVEVVVAEVRRLLEERDKTPDSEVPDLEREAGQLRREIERLAVAVATSETRPEVLVRQLDERQRRLNETTAKLAAARSTTPTASLEARRAGELVRERIEHLGTVLARNVSEGRGALEALLDGPLRFSRVETDEGPRYQIQGRIGLLDSVLTDSVPSGVRSVGTPDFTVLA